MLPRHGGLPWGRYHRRRHLHFHQRRRRVPRAGLNVLGPGTLTLTGTETYSGDTLVSDGTLQVGNPAAIPSGAGYGNVEVNGTLDLDGQNVTINGLSGSGTVTNNGSEASTLTVGANDQTSEFAGTITDGSGSVALVKIGTGTLTLSAAESHKRGALTLTGNDNDYSGGTTVSAGVLDATGPGDLPYHQGRATAFPWAPRARSRFRSWWTALIRPTRWTLSLRAVG